MARRSGARTPTHGSWRIDATAARGVPGVRLVVTAAELGDLNQPTPLLIPHPTLTQGRTQRPLAADEVRYVGEVVAFVVADSRYIAEDAAALIEVQYEPLPVVTDLATALSPGAPRVHPEVPDNRAARFRQTVGDADGAARARPARFSASGSRSSEAAGARSRRAAWWPSGTHGGASSGCGIRRRRRCPSRTASRGSSACPNSTWRSSRPTWAAASERRSCSSTQRRFSSPTRRSRSDAR